VSIGSAQDDSNAEASVELDIEYRTGDPNLDSRSSQLRARSKEIERNAAEVASETRELAGQLAGQLPVSDTAILLGVSKGRVTQLQVPLRATRARRQPRQAPVADANWRLRVPRISSAAVTSPVAQDHLYMSESLTASEVEHLRTLLQRFTEYDLDQAYV
jgi:hypothetical protein